MQGVVWRKRNRGGTVRVRAICISASGSVRCSVLIIATNSAITNISLTILTAFVDILSPWIVNEFGVGQMGPAC